MFDAIAPKYDFVNRVISFGIDGRWRDRAVRALALQPGARVLDVATGTADLAIAIARSCPTARVTGVDPSRVMLEVGRQKAQRRRLDERVELVHGSAETMAFADGTFDGLSIAFGIRNVPDRMAALREFARVTKRGGRIVVLELGEPDGAWLGPLARLHVHTVVPLLGAMLSGAREYRYLERSIAAFPKRSEFAAMMEAAGIGVLRVEALTMGAASLFVGQVPLGQGTSP
jgi:demethylmenaquinone methyltransferase/2-methoxy-6-polyprenyl-1,4-benzoquinol methylase